MYLVYLLGVLYVAAPLALQRGLSRRHPWPARLCLMTALFWVVAGPLFFIVPTSIDGLVERLLGTVAALWVGVVAVALMRGALAAERTSAAVR
jgi:hypothetical protein